MTLTIKLDRNWSSFQLANSAPPLSVTDSAIAPSARIRPYSSRKAHAFFRHSREQLLTGAPGRPPAPLRPPLRDGRSRNVLVMFGNGLVVFWYCFRGVLVVLAFGNVLVMFGNGLVMFW